MKESEAWWLAGQEFEKALFENRYAISGSACGMAYRMATFTDAAIIIHQRGQAHIRVMEKLGEETFNAWGNRPGAYLFPFGTHYEERALACYLLALECEDEENATH